MDPFTLALCVAVAAYVTGAPDRHTLRATRGAASFVKAGARGAYRHRKAERAKTAGQRAKERKARHARLWKSGGWGKAAVIGERGLWHAGRATANATRHAWAGVREGAASYQPAADSAWTHRLRRKAERQIRRKRRREAAERAFLLRDHTQNTAETPPAAPATADTTPKENPMTDAPAALVTELDNVQDLRKEAERQLGIVEEALDLLPGLNDWRAEISERLGAARARFGTPAITTAFGAVADVEFSARPLLAIHENLQSAIRAIDATTQVTEAADALQAQGTLAGYASN